MTEAGPVVFDLLYRVYLSCQLHLKASRLDHDNNLQLAAFESSRHLYNISMTDLLHDLSNLLIGVSSKSFLFNEVNWLPNWFE